MYTVGVCEQTRDVDNLSRGHTILQAMTDFFRSLYLTEATPYHILPLTQPPDNVIRVIILNIISARVFGAPTAQRGRVLSKYCER